MSDDFADAVSKALRRAYSLGQTYWQQADSESYSQNRKADDTSRKFAALVDETRALALARSGQAASGSSQGARSDEQTMAGQPEAPTAAALATVHYRVANGERRLVCTLHEDVDVEPGTELYAHPPARSGAGSEESRDAARYRWLRESVNGLRGEVVHDDCGRHLLDGPQLDRAIDAEIAGSEEGGHE